MEKLGYVAIELKDVVSIRTMKLGKYENRNADVIKQHHDILAKEACHGIKVVEVPAAKEPLVNVPYSLLEKLK